MSTVLPHEVDELTQYVFKNYHRLLTLPEKLAYKALMAERKAELSSSQEMKQFLRGRFAATDPAVMNLMSFGARNFLTETRDRVLREHQGEVFLNRCPKCGSLARTPKACLCPACSHTWYEQRSA